MQEAFAKSNERAWFAPASACPPLFGKLPTASPGCMRSNTAVQEFLIAHPHVRKVVLSAWWMGHFSDDRPGHEVVSNQKALVETVRWLRARGVDVVVIGQPPSYRQSVPATLALEAALGKSLLHSSAPEQTAAQELFRTAVNAASLVGKVSFLDPVLWLCDDKLCRVAQEGIPLYRDAHHLSVEGAMVLEPQLAAGLRL